MSNTYKDSNAQVDVTVNSSRVNMPKSGENDIMII